MFAVVLVAGTLSAYAVYRDLFGKIRQVKVTGLGHRPPGYNHSLNVLVIGSDTRTGKNSRFGAHIPGQRSDTVLVLHLSPGFRRAVVMSIPRDSVVPVLACPRLPGSPGQAAQPGQIEQINETFSNGGPGCLWKTIEQTTHIRLDHFMELNFTGFEHVINDLGGVRICLPYPISDRRSKLRLSRGIHHVMGAEALAYWRVRYIGVGSDLERIQRDQYLMASVAQEVKHTNLLGDPARVLKLVSDIAGSLTTDSGLSQSAMITLVQSLRHLPLRAVHFVEVPVVTYPPNPNWVQWSGQAATLFKAIAQDRKLPRVHKKRHGRRAHPASSSSSGRPGSPSSSGRSGSPSASRSPPPSPLSGLSRHYGGITAGANVCSDSSAFQGPLGGH
ncbi:MAG TPA: LCP family protein [Streptosporangiaceae bacterium]|nr:LCP family protein [Streptosporangiaceae bacterium]